MQQHDSICVSTPQQKCLSCPLISSCSTVMRSRVPWACLAFFTLQTDPALAPLMNMILPPPFWGKYSTKHWHWTDSVCLVFFQSVYWMVMWSFVSENWEGQSIIHWWLTIELTIWPGRKTSWKWCMCESNITHSSAKKLICVGSNRSFTRHYIKSRQDCLHGSVVRQRGCHVNSRCQCRCWCGSGEGHHDGWAMLMINTSVLAISSTKNGM